MAFVFPASFLIAADLMLASALSCFLYALACTCLVSLTGFVILYSSFRVGKKMKRKGRNIILTSSSSIGLTLSKILDKAGFEALAACQTPEEEQALIQKKCSSPIKETQIPEAKGKSLKEMQTHIGSHLSLKGISGAVKKPSAVRWEGKTEFGKPNACEGNQNYHVTPAFLIALLCVPTKLVCHSLKKRSLQLLTTLHTALMKFQD